MRPWSIFARVAGLALLVLVVSMAINFALILLVPAPAPGRMNVEEMAWALKDKPSFVIDARVRPAPPSGQRSKVVEAALSKALGVAQADVRAVWVGGPDWTAGPGENIVHIGDREILVNGNASELAAHDRDDASVGRLTIIPLFTGAVRIENDQWRWGIPHDPARAAWLWRILGVFLIAALILMPPVWLIARRVVAPIEQLGHSASATNLAGAEPFPIAGPREIQATARAMNGMHNRLVAQAADRVRMVAAIAHDLRTPITALRLRVNAVDEPLRGRMSNDLSRMAGMIDELLNYARIGGRKPQPCKVDLSALLAICVANRRDADTDIDMSGIENIIVSTDPELVSRAVENLIDNAVRYGKKAHVSVWRSADWAIIQIDDDGPGIPDHLLATAMKPFERLEGSRSRQQGGTGLGLSIVDDIAKALGARFELQNQSRGLRALFSLPLHN